MLTFWVTKYNCTIIVPNDAFLGGVSLLLCGIMAIHDELDAPFYTFQIG